MEDALDVCAEVIRHVLDEHDLINHHGVWLRKWLGHKDADQLQYLLGRITGPTGPTFTDPDQEIDLSRLSRSRSSSPTTAMFNSTRRRCRC
jgi:hypothetical protein